MDKRLVWEARTVEKMVVLYCRHNHQQVEKPFSAVYKPGPLCAVCYEVLNYAHCRIDRCRYGANKPTCAQCTTHCFKPEMRDAIRRVMRYAGPRMLWYHPITAIRHTWIAKNIW